MPKGALYKAVIYIEVLYSEPIQGRSKIILRVKRGRLGSWSSGINTHIPTIP